MNTDKIVLVHEGSMKFNRGLKLMLELFTDDFFRKHTKLKIVGALSGHEMEYFRQKKKEYDINDSMLEITGWVNYEDLHKHLTGNIGVIFFEKAFNAYYSMPNKLFNYLNVGLPILSTHCGELSDFIAFNKIGFDAERNIDSIKIGVNNLISNYDYYLENIKRAQSLFTWKADEKRLFSLYEKMLG